MDGSPYLTLPIRTETQAASDRGVIADRAALYARMLDYDEARADYVARCSWAGRRGHFVRYMDEQPTWAPLPHTQDDIAAHTLHPDATAVFWDCAVAALTAWLPIVDDLRDSAATQHDRELAEYDRRQLGERIKRAREWAQRLRDEQAKRRAA